MDRTALGDKSLNLTYFYFYESTFLVLSRWCQQIKREKDCVFSSICIHCSYI